MNGNETLAAILQHKRGSGTEALDSGWKKRQCALYNVLIKIEDTEGR
jgi:hypothetical protein